MSKTLEKTAAPEQKEDRGPWCFYHSRASNRLYKIPFRKPRVMVDHVNNTARVVHHEELYPDEKARAVFTPARGIDGMGSVYQTSDPLIRDYLRSKMKGDPCLQEVPYGADLFATVTPKAPPSPRMLPHQVPTSSGAAW